MADRIRTPESETRMFLRGEVSKAEDGWKWRGEVGDDAGERRYKRKDTWPTRGKQPKRKVKVLRSGDAVQKSWWKFGAKKGKKAVPFQPPKPGQPGYGPGPKGPEGARTSTSPFGGPTGPGGSSGYSFSGRPTGPTGPNTPLGRTTSTRPPMTAEQKRAAEARNPFSERRKILNAEADARRAREMRDYNNSQLSYKDSGQRPR